MSNVLQNNSNLVKATLLEYFSSEEWPKLKMSSLCILAALLSRAVPLVGLVSVSRVELRKMLRVNSNRAIDHGLQELCDKGYLLKLEEGGGRGHPTVYKVCRRGRPETWPVMRFEEGAAEKLMALLDTLPDGPPKKAEACSGSASMRSGSSK